MFLPPVDNIFVNTRVYIRGVNTYTVQFIAFVCLPVIDPRCYFYPSTKKKLGIQIIHFPTKSNLLAKTSSIVFSNLIVVLLIRKLLTFRWSEIWTFIWGQWYQQWVADLFHLVNKHERSEGIQLTNYYAISTAYNSCKYHPFYWLILIFAFIDMYILINLIKTSHTFMSIRFIPRPSIVRGCEWSRFKRDRNNKVFEFQRYFCKV
jgi:hypothetical protein